MFSHNEAIKRLLFVKGRGGWRRKKHKRFGNPPQQEVELLSRKLSGVDDFLFQFATAIICFIFLSSPSDSAFNTTRFFCCCCWDWLNNHLSRFFFCKSGLLKDMFVDFLSLFLLFAFQCCFSMLLLRHLKYEVLKSFSCIFIYFWHLNV